MWSEDPGVRKLILTLIEQSQAFKNYDHFEYEDLLNAFIRLINDKFGIPNTEPPVLTREAIEKLNNAGFTGILNSLKNESDFEFYYMSEIMNGTSQINNEFYQGDEYNVEFQRGNIILLTNTQTGQVYEIDLNKMVENLDGEGAKKWAIETLVSLPAEALLDMWIESTFYSHSASGTGGTFCGGTTVKLNNYNSQTFVHETGHALSDWLGGDYDSTEEFVNAFNIGLQRYLAAGYKQASYKYENGSYEFDTNGNYCTTNPAECFAETYSLLMLGYNISGSVLQTYFPECIELVKKYIKEVRNLDYDSRRQ